MEDDTTEGSEVAADEPVAEAPAERVCAETAEAFGKALADVFLDYEAPADPEAAAEQPLEWSELQAWNDLQSQRYFVEEGADHGRLSFRYHAWGMAMPQLAPTLRGGPLSLDEGPDDQYALFVGDPEEPLVTIALLREDGCLRLDEN